jgi:putative ABC transport system permease protein
VTQFEVRIDRVENAERIAAEIDELFRTAEEPTDTRSSARFLADATRELQEILGFARLFGVVCVGVVLVLVANTVLVAVRERRSEFGVYLTLGYTGRHLLAFVISETVFLTLAGAAVGLCVAFVLIRFSRLAIGVEGISVSFTLSPGVFATALGAALLAAILAAIGPAVGAARSNVTQLLRSA